MYKYNHLIPENIAPVGAKKIAVYNGNSKVCDVALGRLTPPIQAKQYSFLALSDVHIVYDTASTDFQRALTFAENSDCAFTCICGDLTDDGSDSQLTTYKNAVTAYAKTKPVYAIVGNHEAGNDFVAYDRPTPYTGYPLYYSFSYGNDVYIMLGTYRWLGNEPLSTDELQWLYETLEANRNKRCFVFEHVFPWGGAGNANGVYPYDIWTSKAGTAFENLMRHYKNTVLFHGHSHLRFYLQEVDKTANYSADRGYRSVHIPSLSVPRDIATGGGYETIYAESEGYVVDVYDDCIILNGRDFIDNGKDGNILPIATYKIDTALRTIAPDAFTDSTGIIVT